MRSWILGTILLLAAGCLDSPAPAAADDPQLVVAPVQTVVWVTSSVKGAFTGWAAPPAASGSLPDSEVHKVEVNNGTSNATRLLRLTMDETPRGRAEYYVAPPSCKDPEVSECRSEKGYVDKDFRIYEAKWPEQGTWRFQVMGSSLGVAEVKYTVKIESEHLVG